MEKILLVAFSIISLFFINSSFAEETKEFISQENKSDDAMKKEMGHDMKHHRMKHNKISDEKKDESLKEGSKKEDEKN